MTVYQWFYLYILREKRMGGFGGDSAATSPRHHGCVLLGVCKMPAPNTLCRIPNESKILIMWSIYHRIA